ncbi:TonB-dependent receptor [Flavobacterium beibuense]|uniref:Thiamin-regulated outer membrane receptor Omr1 n=1 Tax=Flavobacterium beibuense TaxID=657326 RepID=A0A444W5Z1_9FLAO|nr:TonB-dependent receptor [Flavobacterium beibuense]RYJ41291.1 Thiamin-regulated outer membrane receptor Omr1 [Flavobacterium beibuense]
MKTLFISKSQKAWLVALGLFALSTHAQENKTEQDSIKTQSSDYKMDEVLVSAVRVDKKTPVTFTNVSKEELAPRNLGQDIPVLLNYLPSVVTTTDAGAGIGYTSMRVRGSDATRINVTVNGIPYNDAESQGSFWVNMGDFASSTENIQLQRGVGTSTNGAGAFGASLNLLTDAYSKKSSGEISTSIGSFNSMKNTVKFSTGLMNDHFEIAGRLSKIESDGYIDRAFSDLKSYFLQGTYVGKTTLIKALVFGGKEQTYQAWNGLEDTDKLENDRTYNSAGEYTDENGVTRFYDNETDNYQQDHYQLHWNEKISDNWSTNAALHYTIGKGYYEQYRQDEDFADYGLNEITIGGETINSTDLIRRRWLENDFYGTTFSANYKNDNVNVIVGGALNRYEGDHFGEIIWARYASQSEIRDRYYDDNAVKTDFNAFAKANWQLNQKLNLFGDMQYRRVRYKADGVLADPVNDLFNFFNPKAGLTYTLNNQNNIYFSYARANREPRRDDYENGSSKPETLNDFELGWRYTTVKTRMSINGYYMRYKDQLVLTGALNDVGAPVYTNSGDSYRLGIEADATFFLTDFLILHPNVSVSTNKNIDFYFQRDGELQNLGNTNIAYSPNLVAANALTGLPVKNLQITLLSKYVGEQYMGNIDSDFSKLDSYFINDLNVSYEFKTNKIFKSIMLSGLINNIFNVKYESNGYFYTYDDDFSVPGTITTVEGAGYYPQAGINFLAGATLKF